MSVSTVLKTVETGLKAHKPEIMIGFGLAAGAGAIFAAVKETPACLDAFDAEKEKLEDVEIEVDGEKVMVKPDLDWKTKVIILAKAYWKAGLLEAASIVLIICGSKIRIDSYAAIAAVYGITKSELEDLKQVISEQPENWKKKFTEKMAESHLDKTTVDDIPDKKMSNTEVPMPVQLRWDDQAEVYYRLTDNELRDALAEFTHEVTTDPFQSTCMNDWMRIIGHEPVVSGDYYLMTANDGALKYTQIGVKEAPNGEPAIMMRFSQDYTVDTRAIYCD